ncbi:MAG: hypothetical protein D3906_00540 [Candidatus Electrothrix sp. AUS1_2]|nr:hypothetical protein [Candidatus Electrothrix sp. AUS1_2]
MCCEDLEVRCAQYCGSSSNISSNDCSDHSDSIGNCVVDGIVPCECIVPPAKDSDPPSNPEPDPDDLGDNPGDGKSPDPDDDPDNQKTCSDYQAGCSPSCEFACSSDPDTGKALRATCDCGSDPADPGLDGIPGTPDDGPPGSADDGANGWLKEIEENTDKTASGIVESNGWLKSLKSNSDESLEDTDNISQNTRLSMENDQKYFSSDNKSVFKDKYNDSVFNDDDGHSVYTDKFGESVFKDLDGNSYLLKISDSLEKIETSGTSPSVDSNSYSSSLSSLSSVPEDTLSQNISNYIATGIPLASWIKESRFNLTSSSPVLSFSFWGHPYSVDFSVYQAPVDIAGNLLFYLTVLSSFMLIITRFKK